MKKLSAIIISAAICALIAPSAQAGLTNAVYWNFGTSTPSGTAVSNSFASLTVSTLTSGNSFGGYSGTAGNTLFNGTSASAAYTTAAGFANSAGTNAGVGASIAAFNTATNAYFQTSFSLDLSSLVTYTFTNVSFGSRATATGPQSLSLYSSTDGTTYSQVGSSIASANNSTWSAKEFAGLALLLNPGDSLYIRIYGSGGTGSPGSGTVNWRMDDLALAFITTPVAVPEPSTVALSAIGGFAFLFAFRRRR
jgi:hypothetical protein